MISYKINFIRKTTSKMRSFFFVKISSLVESAIFFVEKINLNDFADSS